jgi:hypothetical protein
MKQVPTQGSLIAPRSEPTYMSAFVLFVLQVTALRLANKSHIFLLVSYDGVISSPLCASATIWPTVPE